MKFILIVLCFLTAGCASSGLNGFCGRVSGTGLTVPYVGGKADGNVYVCHVGCTGFTCPKPDIDAFTAVMSKYMEGQGDKITTSMPGTVTFTPNK